MKQLFSSPEIARLGPGAFLKVVIARVWPFIAVSFLFALLVLLVPRTMAGGADVWLAALRPMNAMLRELALGSLLLLAGVVLLLRRLPPGRSVLLFTASLSEAFFTFFLYLAALFIGLLLAWPLWPLLNVPMQHGRAVLLGPLYGLLSAVLVYVAFMLIHRLGAGAWPGESEQTLFLKLDGKLGLERVPDIAVRGIGVALLVVFFVLFWTGLLL